MAGPLINTDYVALVSGRDLTDAEIARADGLIPIASNLVRGAFRNDSSAPTAPEAARLATARLVMSVLERDAENLRAEQIGDYRAEFQRGDATQLMDVSIIADLVRGRATTARSIRVNLPEDGVDE